MEDITQKVLELLMKNGMYNVHEIVQYLCAEGCEVLDYTVQYGIIGTYRKQVSDMHIRITMASLKFSLKIEIKTGMAGGMKIVFEGPATTTYAKIPYTNFPKR